MTKYKYSSFTKFQIMDFCGKFSQLTVSELEENINWSVNMVQE